MLRGYYIAASGMLNQQKNLDVISNNITNSQTVGYKRARATQTTFDEQLILVKEMQESSGTFSTLYTDSTVNKNEQGMLEYTESPLDAAIVGPAWFNIQSAGTGTVMLTRNGQWTIDGEGYLSLGTQGRILGENGEIFLGTSDFVIDTSGAITLTDGTYVDTLQLTYIADDADMTNFGENMYTSENGEPVPEGIEVAVLQGAYEKSNVDVTYEMTRAMEVQRVYEACSSALRMIDGINAKSASIGKL